MLFEKCDYVLEAYMEKNEFCGRYGFFGKKKLAENLA